ncbi:MAG TPA: hypothetical protein H9946_05320 [Candidatus Jeotgalibaca pullicola]|nr:hypothetical protein [Candidatus Jeotgalibaca pullicola]
MPGLVNEDANTEKLLAVNSSKYHGLTFCTGSLGPDLKNVRAGHGLYDRAHGIIYLNG